MVYFSNEEFQHVSHKTKIIVENFNKMLRGHLDLLQLKEYSQVQEQTSTNFRKFRIQ